MSIHRSSSRSQDQDRNRQQERSPEKRGSALADECLQRDIRTRRPQHGSDQFKDRHTKTEWNVSKSVSHVERNTKGDVETREAAFQKMRDHYESREISIQDTPANRRAMKKLYPERPTNADRPDGAAIEFAAQDAYTQFEVKAQPEYTQAKPEKPQDEKRAKKEDMAKRDERSEQDKSRPSVNSDQKRQVNAQDRAPGRNNDPEPSNALKIQPSPGRGSAGGGRGREQQQNLDHVSLDDLEERRGNFSKLVYQANLKGNKALKKAEVPETTQYEYQKVARRLEKVPMEQFPEYFEKRREEIARSSWVSERTIARKTLIKARVHADREQQHDQVKKIQQIDKSLQKLKWGDRKARNLKPLPKTKLGVTPKQHADLKQAVKNDETLHDALVIARATGARPQEMRNGIKLERVQDDVVKVSIIGAKKHKGFKYAKEARFRAPKGKDRELLIKDPDLAEMASRRKQFKVDKMKPLQDKLRRVRQKVPGAESVSFYSYRHQHKTDLEKQGVDRETIAAGMGQLGSKSQDAYGVKTQVSPKRKNFRKRTIL